MRCYFFPARAPGLTSGFNCSNVVNAAQYQYNCSFHYSVLALVDPGKIDIQIAKAGPIHMSQAVRADKQKLGKHGVKQYVNFIRL